MVFSVGFRFDGFCVGSLCLEGVHVAFVGASSAAASKQSAAAQVKAFRYSNGTPLCCPIPNA